MTGTPGQHMWQILLVGEDQRGHELLARGCARLARVLRASTAAEAKQAFARRVIHLVVLDCRLPDASGLDLLAAIRTQWPRLPVFISSAVGSEAICASALKLGARDYFIKPWAVSEMAASIYAVLTAAQRQREARRNVLAPQPRFEPKASAGEGKDEAAIKQVAQRMTEDCSEPTSFCQLARDLGLSKSALSRKFKRAIKVSYRRYVSECRVARARELLSASDYTITEIAQLVGFGDLPRFDKVFKALVGASPSHYRRRRVRTGMSY